jgi:hypothetical protein
MTDRLKVAFHPSLPAHSQRLMAALDVDVRFDDTVPRRCECDGCQAYRRAENATRLTAEVRRLVRAGICPLHRGPQPCAVCERDQVEP